MRETYIKEFKGYFLNLVAKIILFFETIFLIFVTVLAFICLFFLTITPLYNDYNDRFAKTL